MLVYMRLYWNHNIWGEKLCIYGTKSYYIILYDFFCSGFNVVAIESLHISGEVTSVNKITFEWTPCFFITDLHKSMITRDI